MHPIHNPPEISENRGAFSVSTWITLLTIVHQYHLRPEGLRRAHTKLSDGSQQDLTVEALPKNVPEVTNSSFSRQYWRNSMANTNGTFQGVQAALMDH